MSLNRIGRRWLASLVLGTVAPLVLAQMTPPGAVGTSARGHDNPAWQDCRKRADAQKVATGDARQQFMRQCLESKRADSDAAKSEAARAKMGDPQSGHLHSDPPPVATSPKK